MNVPDDCGIGEAEVEGGQPIPMLWERHGRFVRLMFVSPDTPDGG